MEIRLNPNLYKGYEELRTRIEDRLALPLGTVGEFHSELVFEEDGKQSTRQTIQIKAELTEAQKEQLREFLGNRLLAIV